MDLRAAEAAAAEAEIALTQLQQAVNEAGDSANCSTLAKELSLATARALKATKELCSAQARALETTKQAPHDRLIEVSH